MASHSGIGGLLTTEVETVDLGEFDGVRLEGRVQHRVLQIGIGGRRGFRLEMYRTCILVFEKTNVCDDSGISSAFKMERR